MKAIFNFSDCKNDIGSLKHFLIHKSVKKVKTNMDKHLSAFITFIVMFGINYIEIKVSIICDLLIIMKLRWKIIIKSCLQKKKKTQNKGIGDSFRWVPPLPDSTHLPLFCIRYYFFNLLLKALPSNSAKWTWSRGHIQSHPYNLCIL